MANFKVVENEFGENESSLSLNAMAIAVQSQKEIQRNKGRTFNCVVLDNDITQPDSNEFVDFFRTIYANKHNIQDDTRVQVLYKTRDHWSTIDFRIKDNQIEIFMLDAANSLPQILHTMAILNRDCPDIIIRYYSPTLQNDNLNCAYFALHHAVSLSKLKDLHDQVSTIVSTGPLGEHESYAAYITDLLQSSLLNPNTPRYLVDAVIGKVKYIPVGNIPTNFGSLIKNAQSTGFYDSIFRSKSYKTHKGVSLDQYVDSHMAIDFTKGRIILTAIMLKKIKIKTRALAYLNAHASDFEQITAMRSTLSFNEQTKELSTISNLPVKSVDEHDTMSVSCSISSSLSAPVLSAHEKPESHTMDSEALYSQLFFDKSFKKAMQKLSMPLREELKICC